MSFYEAVVRPNHYLSQGTFGKEQHLLPESFYTPGQQVEAELKSLNDAASPKQTQEESLALQSQQAPEQISRSGESTSSNSNSAELDSYANIGGLSGRVASTLTNNNEYGETVPQAFSNLDKDSYAYYHKN